MKLNVKRDDIVFGTNILDLRVPSKLRERHPCGVDYLDAAFGGEGFTPSTISLFTGEPGAGKTTLMLTLANALTSQGYVCLFNTAEELRCLFLFIRSLPYNPIIKIYPEAPFLFFKGISVPQSFDLSEEMARDIETFMKGQNSEYYSDLRLHDLEQTFIDAYESAIRIYNDMVEKTRDSYHASVKLAKTQVFEISAVFVCLFVLILTLIGIS